MDTPNSTAIAFVTILGEELLHEFRWGEVFIDSTYKTNSSKLELFTVIVSVFGVWFPIAYLVMSNSDNEMQRQEIVADFLEAVKSTFPRLNPLFFYSDKDRGQLNAIKKVFKIMPSLCYWHMKNAVRKKLIRMRRDKTCVVTDEEENTLMKIITSHYNMHPALSRGKSMGQLKTKALQEIQTLFS